MKRILCAALAVCMLFILAGCGLFSDDSTVRLGDYTHTDPKGVTYDQRIVLKNENFGDSIASVMSSDAYPDLMIADENGNITGMYNYDETTGLASGWTDITDGTYYPFEAGQEVNLGKPDASKLVTIPGTVSLYFVVYGNQEQTVRADMYLMLSDAGAKDIVLEGMSIYYGLTLEAESDTVLKYTMDQNAINAEFDNMAAAGYGSDIQDASAYAQVLMQSYGVREDMGANPYKPYEGHQDPSDLTFDRRVVLTGNGQAAVEEEYADDIASMTDYVYANDGNVVAHYTYFECTSKDAADEIFDYLQGSERVSDTVVGLSYTGSDMQDLLTTYIGYNVLKDKSVDDYVRMLQETYYSSIWE